MVQPCYHKLKEEELGRRETVHGPVRAKNYEEAIQFLDKAIELNNEYYLAWFAKWQALRGLNREAEAEECLKRAIALNPEYVTQALSGEYTGGRHTSNMRAKLKRS